MYKIKKTDFRYEKQKKCDYLMWTICIEIKLFLLDFFFVVQVWDLIDNMIELIIKEHFVTRCVSEE